MKRILRVIEYTGTDEFLQYCIDNRQVKGTKTLGNGTIREAILGDTPEILSRYTEQALQEEVLGPVLEGGKKP